MSKEKIINLDSNIDLPSDALTFTSASIQRFIDETEEFQFDLGYEGKTLPFYGLADEWTINITPNSAGLSVKGRDYLKNAIDNNFQKTYYLTKPDPPYNHYLDPVTGIGEPLPYTWGVTLASEVAKEIAASVNLTLVWNCPDYNIINATEQIKGFNGTVLSCLQELIRPLNQTEMFKIDILIQKDVIYVQKRQYPYIADYTLPYTDIRIKDLSITKTNYRSKKIKNIYIGRDERSGLVFANVIDEPPEVIDTIDVNGEVVSKQIITKRRVGNSDVRKTDLTYLRLYGHGTPMPSDFSLQKEIREDYFYEGGGESKAGTELTLQINEGMGIKSKLIYKRTRTTIYKKVPGQSNMYKAGIDDADTFHKYQGNVLQSTHQTTYKKEFNIDGTVKTEVIGGNTVDKVIREEIIIRYNQISANIMEVSTTKFIDGTEQDTIVANQPGTVPSISNAGIISNTKSSWFWWKKIIVRETGEDLELHNDLFSRELLWQIGQEIKTEQLAVKYEINLNVLPMPWLRKGMKIKIDGVVRIVLDGIEQPFDLSQLVFFITNISYARVRDSFIGNIQGVAWL